MNTGAKVTLAHANPDAGGVMASDALLAAAREAATVAQRFADAVDQEARFPHEAFEVLRDQGLLGAMVPAVLGGSGASLATVAAICKVLGETCASTGMIYAMHQIQVACLLDHGTGSPWHQHLLARIAGEQLLLASATSEEAIGGALRSSGCAVNVDGDRFHLLKMAPTISYGAHADGILITARRNADASPSDQVLVCALKSDYTLQGLNAWDTLGMRGTCSNGFRLEATGQVDQVLPVPFGEIADATMTPVSHILWSSLWLGIASDAVSRAKTFFQGQARARPGQLPPSASRVSEAVSLLQMMEGRVDLALAHQRSRHAGASVSAAFALAAEMNGLKTAMSTMALEVVQQALLVCGMAGYKHGTPFSLGRHLRDLWSAPLMINNDRIQTNTANLLLADRS
ncbi:acyl-CoA dehydrogenase family protein [Cupriavidus metallidurans]|uniref:acyl-CoA dehydrogenase family protein n=1 Tax=Cupriavidus TaxID=106589 RepID=UPI0002A25346|nr:MULTISPECIES: acyl-CoA dehydrogenase family protein [Cupriavidus]EKZ96816.1 acyl-CoA dehydrogenase [Cupriavidus sp. HMR-1]GMG92696.1 acyl-CoA dehydrogenase [Cupriavidus sp. TKC]HBD36363.1 acyl-CoA dehydrogenase [Cupriavidus sp.]HBO80571.1 acyl-CoA dehydrogenase [Cupriavidus sp.]